MWWYMYPCKSFCVTALYVSSLSLLLLDPLHICKDAIKGLEEELAKLKPKDDKPQAVYFVVSVSFQSNYFLSHTFPLLQKKELPFLIVNFSFVDSWPTAQNLSFRSFLWTMGWRMRTPSTMCDSIAKMNPTKAFQMDKDQVTHLYLCFHELPSHLHIAECFSCHIFIKTKIDFVTSSILKFTAQNRLLSFLSGVKNASREVWVRSWSESTARRGMKRIVATRHAAFCSVVQQTTHFSHAYGKIYLLQCKELCNYLQCHCWLINIDTANNYTIPWHVPIHALKGLCLKLERLLRMENKENLNSTKKSAHTSVLSTHTYETT